MALKHFILASVAAFAAVYSASAQNNEALTFISIDRSPRVAAMAGAGSASTSSIAYSAFTNSAVLPFYGGSMEAGVAYQMWAPKGVKSSNINFGTGLKISDRFGLSVGGVYQKGEPYMTYHADGSAGKEFTPNDMLVNLGLGFLLVDNLSAGVNVRYASSTLDANTKLSTVCGDVFFLYKVLPELNVTAGVSSLGMPVKASDGTKFPIPASASLGASYKAALAPDHSVEAVLDADYFFSGHYTAALGAEYAFKDMVFVRAGYHYGNAGAALPSFLSLGAGVKFAGFSLDLAYLTLNDVIGNTLSIGLGYAF